MTGKSPVVVVTRAGEAGRRLVAELEAQGLKAVHAPAFELAPAADPAAARQTLARAREADRVLFTSPAAVHFAVELAGSGAFDGPGLLAPGAGTAEALAGHGLKARYPVRGQTSEDLLAMPELSAVEGARVMILAAPGGRDLIRRTLAGRGARVEVVYVYRRVPVAAPDALVKALEHRKPLVVLVSSTTVLEHFRQELPDRLAGWWREQEFVVSSGRLAARCGQLGIAKVHVAGGASDGEMRRTLAALLASRAEI